jgi:hypothetical protein
VRREILRRESFIKRSSETPCRPLDGKIQCECRLLHFGSALLALRQEHRATLLHVNGHGVGSVTVDG